MTNKHKKITTVVGTYNGEQYILEQLQSIFHQTQKVDEVLICDDGSTDSTLEICENFIQKNNISNWKVIINPEQFGVFWNFIEGCLKATGDIIFFADQDDIWCQDKVETMVSEFEKHPDMLSLTTTFSRFNENVVLTNHVRHPNSKKNGITKIELKDFCVFPYYLGMSMAISKKLLEFVKNEREMKFDITHDLFLNLIAGIRDGLYHLDQVLTKRRSYKESTSNKKNNQEIQSLFNSNIRLYSIYDKIKVLKIFQEIIKYQTENGYQAKTENLKIFQNHIRVSELRFEYLNHPSFTRWLFNFFFVKNYISWKSHLKDGQQIFRSHLV